MDPTTTWIALGAALAVTVFAGWRGARPPDPRKGPRMAPWRFVMLLGGALVFYLLVHLAALSGMGGAG